MRVAASRSHRNERTGALLDRIAEATGTAGEPLALGSSLKFCRPAEGGLDVYPRFGPTSARDPTPGHALRAPARRVVLAPPGQPRPLNQPRTAPHRAATGVGHTGV